MSWRDSLQPASFRGVTFHVETGAQATGRRAVLHEFPKRDTPYAEDLGRKGRRFSIRAYLLGPNYIILRNALTAAMESEGPGTLVHPTMGSFQMQPEGCSVTESRERGGYVEAELSFMEAGVDPSAAPVINTQGVAQAAAGALGSAAAASLDRTLQQSTSI